MKSQSRHVHSLTDEVLPDCGSLLPLVKGSPAATVLGFALALTATCAFAGFNDKVPAPKEQGWNPNTTFMPLSPADAMKTIEVPKGYRLECVASEPLVEEPAAFAFDPDGALYVCEWRTFMQDEFGTDQLAPVSRVVKLTDTNGDGAMDRRTVFIDTVVLPRSVFPMGDRVIVNFTNDKTYWAYFDDNKDGVADRREAAYVDGPDKANIEHQRSGMLWNLDNTLCTNDAIFRLKPDGTFDAAKHSDGRISQWGLAHDDDGRLYSSLAGGANPALGFQLPAGYPILRVKEHGAGYGRPYSICKVWDQSSGNYDFKMQIVLTEFSACCGQTVLRSPLMPEFDGNLVTCEPVGRLLRMSRFEWKDGLGTAHNAFPRSEFIRSTDAYFRPVWTESGPDGCLYIADMYRGIIQEKAWFATEDNHPRQDWVTRYKRVKKWGMTGVVRHGRIYRLVPEGKAPGPQPRMLADSPAQLASHLAHPNGWWRDTAQMLLVSRQEKSSVPALITIAKTHTNLNARIHAFWTLHGLGALPKELVIASLADSQPRLRRAAVQLSETLLASHDAEITAALAPLAHDADAQVLAQLFHAYRRANLPIPAVITAQHTRPLLSAVFERDKSLTGKAIALSDSAKKGRDIYQTLCTACHGPDGQGMKVDAKQLAPNLTKSKWLARPGDGSALARILLHGLTGPIDGVTYGEGIMPPLAEVYADEQIASVLNYVGETWHGWKKPVTIEVIKTTRESNKARKTPWSVDELQRQPQGK
jgi:mono/diheme cytochrome c family protein